MFIRVHILGLMLVVYSPEEYFSLVNFLSIILLNVCTLYLLGARNLDAPEKLKIFYNKIVKRSLKMKIKFNFVGKNKN